MSNTTKFQQVIQLPYYLHMHQNAEYRQGPIFEGYTITLNQDELIVLVCSQNFNKVSYPFDNECIARTALLAHAWHPFYQPYGKSKKGIFVRKLYANNYRKLQAELKATKTIAGYLVFIPRHTSFGWISHADYKFLTEDIKHIPE